MLPAVCQRPHKLRRIIAVTIAAMKQILLQHIQESIQLKHGFIERELDRILAHQGWPMNVQKTRRHKDLLSGVCAALGQT